MLKDLIATPGEAVVGRLAKQYRIDTDVHALLISEIDKAIAAEREACARIAEAVSAKGVAATIRARSNNSN